MRCHVVRPFFLWPVLFLVAVAVCSSFLASIWISRYCVSILVRGTETLVGKLEACFGRYFRTVFGVQFGPGASRTLTPLMVSVTWSRMFTEVHWQCQKCEISRLIKCLCHCGFQRIVHLLKPSIVTVIHDFFYVRAWQSKLSQSKQGREWVGDFISRILVLHSDYSSASRDSIMTLHWSLFRQITQAVCVGFVVTWSCQLSGFYIHMLSLTRIGKKRSRTPWGQHLGGDTAETFWMALVCALQRTGRLTSCQICHISVDLSHRQAWNAVQSVPS